MRGRGVRKTRAGAKRAQNHTGWNTRSRFLTLIIQKTFGLTSQFGWTKPAFVFPSRLDYGKRRTNIWSQFRKPVNIKCLPTAWERKATSPADTQEKGSNLPRDEARSCVLPRLETREMWRKFVQRSIANENVQESLRICISIICAPSTLPDPARRELSLQLQRDSVEDGPVMPCEMDYDSELI